MSFPRNLARTILPSAAFNRVRAVARQFGAFKSLASKYGQYRSMKSQMCVDRAGEPIPWYTYPATEYLGSLNLRAASVFEYGSGNSSRWWASRCGRLVSVESDRVWFELIQPKLTLPNFEYRLADESSYARAIEDAQAAFDVIVVDGIRRADCAEAAIANIRRFGGTMLILDNSDWYPNLVPHIRTQLDWLQIDFHGFGPLNHYTWTTTIFLNPQKTPALAPERPPTSVARVVLHADDDLK